MISVDLIGSINSNTEDALNIIIKHFNHYKNLEFINFDIQIGYKFHLNKTIENISKLFFNNKFIEKIKLNKIFLSPELIN